MNTASCELINRVFANTTPPPAKRPSPAVPVNRKLSESDVVRMRESRAAGARVEKLAADFGVCASLVCGICTGQRRRTSGGPLTRTAAFRGIRTRIPGPGRGVGGGRRSGSKQSEFAPDLTSAEIARFWGCVDKENGPVHPVHGRCWAWKLSLLPIGYAYFNRDNRICRKLSSVGAHRVSYFLKHGPIPADLELDHLCRNRGCVRPEHLEAVRHRINVLRGEAPIARYAAATACPLGHPYSTENTLIQNDGTSRRCRECNRFWCTFQRAKRNARDLRIALAMGASQ